MDSFESNGSVWYSKLESEVLLTDLYSKLSNFPENEKGKVVISWLANSYADLTNTGSLQSDSENYVVHIKLVNKLVSNSSPEAAYDLSDIFSKDFLHEFVKESLLDIQNQHGRAVTDATNHFQLLCDNITQPLLIRKVVKFTINNLLPIFVSRLKSNDPEVLGATLGLFRSLLEFYCEDIWHDLVLQYLLPMKHLLVSERQKAIPEVHFQESTSKFIDMIPSSIFGSLEDLSDQFVMYNQQELQRIHNTSVTISAAIPLSKSEVTGIPMLDVLDQTSEPEEVVNNSRNRIFPLWAFKYDGTDVIYAARRFAGRLSEPEEYFEDDFFQFLNKGDKVSNIEEQDIPPQSSSSAVLRLPDGPETIRFYAEPVTMMHVRPTPDSIIPTNSHSSWKPVSEDQGYFGPFMESLFQILDKWTRLDLDLIIGISDIFSVLASSRIPLITSILLDFSVVLQPCFPNFHGIIHSIKIKLDGSIKKYPQSFVQQEWKRVANNTIKLKDVDAEDLFKTPTNSVTETLQKIMKNSPFKKSTTSRLANLFTDNRTVNSGTSTFVDKEDEMIARKSTLRCIIFSHWMLELAAIAQQSCWFQFHQNHRQREDDQF